MMTSKFSADENGIYRIQGNQRHQICNFQIESHNYYRTANAEHAKNVLLVDFVSVGADGDIRESVVLDIDALGGFDPSSVNPMFVLCSGKRNRDSFSEYVRELLKHIPCERKILVDRLGDQRTETEHFYCAGDMLLGKIEGSDVFVVPEIKKFHARCNPETAPDKAYEAFIRFLFIDEKASGIVGLKTIVGYMSALLKDAAMPDDGVLYIAGNTQSRKTSLLTLANDLFGSESRKQNTIRVDSSLPRIEEFLSQFRNSSSNLDDLYKTAPADIHRTAQMILRQSADDTPRETLRNGNDITQTQLSITAEVLPDNISDLGRVQLIIVNEPIDGQRLAECQAEAEQKNAFYIQFIDWLYRDYELCARFESG